MELPVQMFDNPDSDHPAIWSERDGAVAPKSRTIPRRFAVDDISQILRVLWQDAGMQFNPGRHVISRERPEPDISGRFRKI